jgi:ADP-ribose pyrophosphatase YjhB (NUDIX family)
MARPTVAAGMLFRDTNGHVLLVKPSYKDGWEVPGGYVEPDESPAQGCARELVEELGDRRAPGRLLVVDWAPAPSEGDKLLFLFDGGVLDDVDIATLRPDGEEITEARFWPVSELDNLTPGR